MSCELNVDLQNPVHKNFLGVSAVYHGYAGMPDVDGRVYNEDQCKLEFERVGKMRLKIARTFYGWYSYENGRWNWESEKMQIFCRWVEAMQKNGVDIALQIGWCSPGDINGTSWNGDSPFNVPGDFAKSVENYAKWVSETVHYLVEIKGYDNVKYLSLFTEPQRPSGKLPEGKNAYTAWRDCAKAAHEQLVKDGRRHLVKLVGPNEGSTTTSVMNRWVAENADEYIDIYSSHNYLDFIPKHPGEIPDGERVAFIRDAGGRCQQLVHVEPNTEYEVKVTIRLSTDNIKNISGNILFGAFDAVGGKKDGMISAGGQPTTRLNRDSVFMLDAALADTEWKTYTMTFFSGDSNACNIGLFSDLKNKGDGLYVKEICLYKKGSTENLLKYSDLLDANHFYNVTVPKDEAADGWRQVGCFVCGSDPYYDWISWVETALQYVPENKEYWFDEYNVRSDKDCFDTPLHATRRAQATVALMNSGAQTAVMWTLLDQQWPNNHVYNDDCFVNGDHRYGVMPVLTRTKVPYPSYYSTSLLTRYMGGGEGTLVFSVGSKDHVCASVTKMPDGNISIAVVNCKDKADDIKINFSEGLNRKFNRHIYDPATVAPNEKAEIIPTDKTIEADSCLCDSLPAYAVAVYTTMED